jgi:4'-phosphopantetheinyl transferase
MRASEAEVHYVRLSSTAAELDRLFLQLDAGEQARANRFKVDPPRQAFIATRAALRRLLGERLGIAPEAVAISYGPSGKPFLAGESLSFNLSHADDLAAYAFVQDCDAGIDIEARRTVPDWEGIAKHFFAPAECEALGRMEPSPGAEAFLHCWTRKEAYVKAVGSGLSTPLSSFTVDVSPEAGAGPLLPGWWMHPLHPGPEHIGALVLSREGVEVREFEPVRAAELCR